MCSDVTLQVVKEMEQRGKKEDVKNDREVLCVGKRYFRITIGQKYSLKLHKA